MCLIVLVFVSNNTSAIEVSDKKVNVFYNDLRFERSIKFCILKANKKNYFEFIEPVFSKYKLPNMLIFIPVIESCFNPYAKSSQGALGMWQINDITARHVGLKEGFFTDERYNWKKSTVAAAKYLLFLKKRFDSWELVLAAYNVGPTYLREQISKYKTSNIERLKLPKETRNYVYKFRALFEYLKLSRS